MKTALVLVSSALLLSSCAITGKSIRDVPAIKSQNIQVSALSGLPKRNISLTVVDARDDKNQSAELQTEITRAVTEALAREGTTVSTPGANDLVLTIHNTEMGKYKEGCVKITSSLTIPKKAKLGAEASSCFEMKNPFGAKMSVDITKAYEEALSLIFKNLDQGLGQLNKL
ncbi:hypothetical protein [uncultured Bdellovibrio sp.]|uniref:hypothetical protein n=1 Tax=Bdellovibrio sp. HCB-162 TaxID=3394234 RepID=UPI0025F5B326|nr:hypothetical protein [uncultured Bdellovibrio sp.]